MKIFLASGVTRILCRSYLGLQTDRQTDRQTEPMKLYLAGGLSGNLSPYFQSIASKQASKQAREFLAGNGYHKTEEFDLSRLVGEVTNFQDFNILESYYMLRESEAFMELLTRCNSYLIDSGAFTFMQGTHKEDINWDEYIEQYADFINRWDVKLFFELDIETIVGLPEVERLRAKLEKLTNKRCIPVWHIQRGKESSFECAKNMITLHLAA